LRLDDVGRDVFQDTGEEISGGITQASPNILPIFSLGDKAADCLGCRVESLCRPIGKALLDGLSQTLEKRIDVDRLGLQFGHLGPCLFDLKRRNTEVFGGL
jgi:hypothetical protein